MGSESEQSTTIGEMSQEERDLLGLITDTVLPTYMDEAGYEAVGTSYDSYAETPTGIALKKNIDRWKVEMEELERTHGGALWMPRSDREINAQKAWNELKNKRETGEAEYDTRMSTFTPGTTTYEYEKKETGEEISERVGAELKKVEDEFGKDSPEYEKAKEQYTAKELQAVQKENINQMFLDKVEKYLSGDLSVTPEQEKFIADQMAPVKAAVDAMYGDTAEQSTKNFEKTLKEIGKTNMEVGAAIRVIGEQIQQTGADMDKALTSTIAANRELMKMGIEDATGQITKKISMQAIATGRDPSDAEYTNEISENVARQVKSGELSMTAMEAQGRMGIAERTGAGMEETARSQARLAEATGARREGATTGYGREQLAITEARGGAGVRLAEAGTNLRQQLALGLPPSQIAVGTGFEQLQQTLASQRMANAQAPMSAIGMPYGMMSAERFAQPTTTTSQSMNPAMAALGVAGAGAQIYGGMMTGGAMSAIAGQYGGGYDSLFSGSGGF